MLRRTFVSRFQQLPHYDVCVIGGGPAGVAAALRAVDYGKKVCMVEKSQIGGADLWDGALQSKTMWELAQFYNRLRSFGPRMFTDKTIADAKPLEEKIHSALKNVSTKRQTQIVDQLKRANVEIYKGVGQFQTPNELVIEGKGDEAATVTSDYFIIATGSVPRVHPQYRADGMVIQTSDHIMRTPIPKSLVIIGAGVIGCEFASIYANLGITQVNIIEKATRMLPMEDADVASYVETLLTRKGVRFHHQAALDGLEIVRPEGGATPFVRYGIKNTVTNEKEVFEVERALVSIGRVPNYSGLGLERANCCVINGKLDVDQYGRCKPHKHIYAVGDATVDVALVNMGESEATCAVNHMFKPQRETSPVVDNLSTIMFLDQEVAAVGLNEQTCRQRNIAYIAARYGYDVCSRAIAMGSPEGFVKIIVTNDRQKTVLGVRAVGAHASSIVELASLAIHNNQSVYDLGDMITAYPAMTQGFQECLRMLVDRSILKPNVFPQLRTWAWSPGNFSRGRAYAK